VYIRISQMPASLSANQPGRWVASLNRNCSWRACPDDLHAIRLKHFTLQKSITSSNEVAIISLSVFPLVLERSDLVLLSALHKFRFYHRVNFFHNIGTARKLFIVVCYIRQIHYVTLH